MARDTSWIAVLVLVAAAAALAGCGDDDADGTSGPKAGSSGTGVGGKVGSGAGGSSGSSAGTGGTAGGVAGSMAMTTVECGSQTCMAPAAAMGIIQACCVDAATSTCGTSSSLGTGCMAPSAGHPDCASVDVMGIVMLPSCCIDGQCGIDATQFGSSCMSLAGAREMAMAMGMDLGLPEPSACGEADGGI